MDGEGSHLFDEKIIARNRLRRWLTAAVAALVLVRLAAEVTPAMKKPDLALLDGWQSLRATRRPSPQVVIVAIDEKSLQRFGPPAWPRSEYVPLVERLSNAGAKLIGFDFTFSALEREAANNERFAAAMAKAGNVVFGYEFTDVGDPSPPGSPASALLQANSLQSFATPAIPPAPRMIEPEPVLGAAAAALGHVHTVASEDGKIRVVPLLVQHGGRAYPSLALQFARVFMGGALDGVRAKDHAVTLGGLDVPVSPSGEVLLDWPAGGERAFPQYSFLDVVRGDVKDEVFHGKAVLIAGTASGLDDRDFPFAVEAPGVLLYATFLDNMFRADFVRAPVWAWLLEWGLFLAACALAVGLMPRLSTPLLLAGVPLLVLLLVATAGFLFVQRGLWLQVVYPGLALLAPLALLAVMRLTASERETRDVAAEKVENQKLLGLSFQEKGMLDMALATFNKLPFADEMKIDLPEPRPRLREPRAARQGLSRLQEALRRRSPLRGRGPSHGAPQPGWRQLELLRGSHGPMPGPTAPPMGAPNASYPAGQRATPQPGAASALAAARAATFPDVPLAGPEPSQQPDRARAHRPARAAGLGRRNGAPQRAAHAGSAGTVVERGGSGHLRERSHGLLRGLRRPAARRRPVRPARAVRPRGPRIALRALCRSSVTSAAGAWATSIWCATRSSTARPRSRPSARTRTWTPGELIEMRQRFYREAQTAGKLNHPHIVTVYDVGEDLGMSYIVMEFVEGQTLTQWMKKARLNVAQIRHVVYHAALGLSYAHEGGVYHRDVKPDNIMVSTSGGVKVMDFGIARVVESSLTQTGSLMGTPAYMSPEQVNGVRVDGRSDTFSLGVILYELLTGRKPFRGDSMSSLIFAITREEPPQPSTVDTNIHPAWDPILKKALAKDREDRYAAVKEFAQAVRDAPVR